MKTKWVLIGIIIISCAVCSAQTEAGRTQNIPTNWGVTAFFGPQISTFKIDKQNFGARYRGFGIGKNFIGTAFGADLELRKKRWIFGLGYSSCENKKRFEMEEANEPYGERYAVDFTLRYTEKSVALYTDYKVNNKSKNEIFLGLGALFSRGDNQHIEIIYDSVSANLFAAAIWSHPSVEGGIAGRFRWEHNRSRTAKFGVQVKIHYLYSVDSWTNTIFTPYIKIVL
jgi:hypothetical protein